MKLPTPSRLLRASLAIAVTLGVAACGGSAASPGTASKTATPATGPSSAASPSPGQGSTAASPASGDVSTTGDIPDNQVFVAFTPSSGGYAVQVPEGWSRTASGSVVSFSDRFNTIQIETQSSPQAPTNATATATEAATLRSSVPGFSLRAVTTVHRAAGNAVLIQYQATSPPEQVTGKTVRLAVERYEFWRGGVEAIVSLSAPVGSDNVDPWRKVTDSFSWR
jgi:hypothetical protein